MVYIKNNPELSALFRSDELKKFFNKVLEELEDPHVLKSFLKNGYENFYGEQMKQLSKSFVVLTPSDEPKTYHSIIRCIDAKIFTVGDVVTDLVASNERPLPIGRIYEDERGLHIRLDVESDKSFTWRDLSTIDHVR